MDGQYEAIAPTDAEWLWSEQLELYLGIHEQQLRWFSDHGQLLPLPEEQERQGKEATQQRAEQLEAVLLSQGINPDQLLDPSPQD